MDFRFILWEPPIANWQQQQRVVMVCQTVFVISRYIALGPVLAGSVYLVEPKPDHLQCNYVYGSLSTDRPMPPCVMLG